MEENPVVHQLDPSQTCSQCIKLDIARLVPCLKPTTVSRCEMKPETCALCKFLLQCLPVLPDDEAGKIENFQLLTLAPPDLAWVGGPTSRALPTPTESRENTYLFFGFRSGHESRESTIAFLSDKQWSGIEPTPMTIEYAMIEKWLEHDRALQHSHLPIGIPPLPVDLVVVDCTSRSLVNLPSSECYLALSYVWGANKLEENGRSLPNRFPQTIEDSITVCKALDFRYLWIDRYCIPQNDAQKRASQIKRMNEIYSNAYAVIIACAGANPSYGLPGVSRARPSSPCLDVGSSGYLQMIPTVHDVTNSVWSTRAWTYQEAYLAKRRLYFTDRQLYFESRDRIESEFTTRAQPLNHSQPSPIYDFIDTKFGTTSDIFDLIQDYSSRKMSFPGDALNALSGVLAYCERYAGIRHLWGLPFSEELTASSKDDSRNIILSIESSLLWTCASASPCRRSNFPTWSWTGWCGPLKYWATSVRPTQVEVSGLPAQNGLKIDVELNSGACMTWNEFQQSYPVLEEGHLEESLAPNSPSHYLHIDADTSPVLWCSACANYRKKTLTSDVPIKSTDGETLKLNAQDSYYERTVIEGIKYCQDSPGMECECFGLQNPYLVIHLTTSLTHDGRTGLYRYGLLVHNVGGHWERLALLNGPIKRFEKARKVRRKIRLG